MQSLTPRVFRLLQVRKMITKIPQKADGEIVVSYNRRLYMASIHSEAKKIKSGRVRKGERKLMRMIDGLTVWMQHTSFQQTNNRGLEG